MSETQSSTSPGTGAGTLTPLSPPLSPVDVIELWGVANDLTLVRMSGAVTNGVLFATDDGPVAALARLGDHERSVLRTRSASFVSAWSRLADGAPFIARMAARPDDAHIEAALTRAGLHDTPEAIGLRAAAAAHGGLAAWIRSQAASVGEELAGQLSAARRLDAFIAGTSTEPPEDLVVFADFAGCATGLTEVLIGGTILVDATVGDIATALVGSPLLVPIAAFGGVVASAGLITVSGHCF